MDRREEFREAVRNEKTAVLATSAGGNVSMRTVSPVPYHRAILIFTDEQSKKYQQLKVNPHAGIAVGGFFAEAVAEFLGSTLLPDNRAYREAYHEKFPDAFEPGAEFGGREAEFILFHPYRITGWAFENDVPTEDGIPTVPFEILIP